MFQILSKFIRLITFVYVVLSTIAQKVSSKAMQLPPLVVNSFYKAPSPKQLPAIYYKNKISYSVPLTKSYFYCNSRSRSFNSSSMYYASIGMFIFRYLLLQYNNYSYNLFIFCFVASISWLCFFNIGFGTNKSTWPYKTM